MYICILPFLKEIRIYLDDIIEENLQEISIYIHTELCTYRDIHTCIFFYFESKLKIIVLEYIHLTRIVQKIKQLNDDAAAFEKSGFSWFSDAFEFFLNNIKQIKR